MPKTRFLFKKKITQDKNLPETKKSKNGIFAQDKKPRLIADYSLDHTGGWGGRTKHNDNDWKFPSYKGTDSGYDMICESVNSDQEEK